MEQNYYNRLQIAQFNAPCLESMSNGIIIHFKFERALCAVRFRPITTQAELRLTPNLSLEASRYEMNGVRVVYPPLSDTRGPSQEQGSLTTAGCHL